MKYNGIISFETREKFSLSPFAFSCFAFFRFHLFRPFFSARVYLTYRLSNGFAKHIGAHFRVVRAEGVCACTISLHVYVWAIGSVMW